MKLFLSAVIAVALIICGTFLVKELFSEINFQIWNSSTLYITFLAWIIFSAFVVIFSAFIGCFQNLALKALSLLIMTFGSFDFAMNASVYMPVRPTIAQYEDWPELKIVFVATTICLTVLLGDLNAKLIRNACFRATKSIKLFGIS